MTCMAVMAVIVFIALFFFKAGYGYLSNSKWGPVINNKTAWVLMEAPAFLFLLYYTIRFAVSGADTGNSTVVLYIIHLSFPDEGKEQNACCGDAYGTYIQHLERIYDRRMAVRGSSSRNVHDRMAVESAVHHRNHSILYRNGHKHAF